MTDLGRSVDPAKLTPRFCDAFIEVGDDPWAGTYCKRRAGHDGDHSPLYPDERQMRKRIVLHGCALKATLYGPLNDTLYVPPHLDWRAVMAPDAERYPPLLTVLHYG